jgi:hypothetical protein
LTSTGGGDAFQLGIFARLLFVVDRLGLSVFMAFRASQNRVIIVEK